MVTAEPGGDGTGDKAGDVAGESAEKLARKVALERVFGAALPDRAREDRDYGDGGQRGDDWYRSQVPPHHG